MDVTFAEVDTAAYAAVVIPGALQPSTRDSSRRIVEHVFDEVKTVERSPGASSVEALADRDRRSSGRVG